MQDICNCSAQNCLRTRRGLEPTKVLTYEAQQLRFRSVSPAVSPQMHLGTPLHLLAVQLLNGPDHHQVICVALFLRPHQHTKSESGHCPLHTLLSKAICQLALSLQDYDALCCVP